MSYLPVLVIVVLLAVVPLLTWLASRRGQRATGCCAPADPRADLRMRGAFDDETESGL